MDNLSDHEPVILELKLNVDVLHVNDKVHISRPSWVRANSGDINNYRISLSERLSSVHVPSEALLCTNLHCNNEEHFQDINLYSLEISKACIASAEDTIPYSRPPGTKGRIPGWNERVRPLREKSIFWHTIWNECGRPRDGVIAGVMRRTRAAYHCELRKVKKNEENIIKERIADSMLNDSGRDFWTEIKKLRKKGVGYSGAIDGRTDTATIAQLFADNCRHLGYIPR